MANKFTSVLLYSDRRDANERSGSACMSVDSICLNGDSTWKIDDKVSGDDVCVYEVMGF